MNPHQHPVLSAGAWSDQPSELGYRKPIGVNQHPGGSLYPFVNDSALHAVFADFYLCYPASAFADSGRCGSPQELSIRTLTVSPAGWHVEIYNNDDQLVLDTTSLSEYVEQAWGDYHKTLQWWDGLDDVSLGANRDSVCRAVIYSDNAGGQPLFEAGTYNFTFEEGRLSARAYEPASPRLRSIIPQNPSDDPVNLAPVSADIVFQEGYNCDIQLEEDSQTVGDRRQAKVITISATPGAGEGKVSDCGDEEPKPLRRIGSGTADKHGNFRWEMEECLRTSRPEHMDLGGSPRRVVAKTGLGLHSECGPCLTCQDVEAVFKAIRNLAETYKQQRERLLAVRDLHVSNIARWEAQKNCRADDALRISIRPICPDELMVGVAYCNSGSECIRNLVIPISFDYTDAAGDVDPATGQGFSADTLYSGGSSPYPICGDTQRAGDATPDPSRGANYNAPEPYTLGGAWPHFHAQWDSVDPGHKAEVQFRLSFPASQTGDTAQLVVDAYSPDPAVGDGSLSPPLIPGYHFGSGPLNQAALDARIVGSPKTAQAMLLQDCCGGVSASLEAQFAGLSGQAAMTVTAV